MNNKLDVFEILNANNKKDQEQHNAPDFNFLNVRELMAQIEKEVAPKPNPVIAPVKKPEPKPQPAQKLAASQPQIVINPHDEIDQMQKTAPKPQPKPVPDKAPAPKNPEPKPQPESVPMTVPGPVPVKAPAPKSPEPKPQPEKPKKDKPAKVKKKKGFIKIIVLVAVIALILAFIIGVPKVTNNSMDPMISSGDHVAVNKLAKNYGYGDIIVFKSTSGEKLTARIVAVKGDVVSLNNIGGLYVNNELQSEENIHTVTTVTDTAVSYPVIVDEDTYFVLGDNRTDSIDSRNSEVGLVDKKDIIGKVIFCFKKI